MREIEELLRSEKVLRLATLDKNGNPHLVPVWYMYQSKKIYIGTNTKTKKAKNLRYQKKVAFCVDKGIKSPDIIGVMGTGKACLILEKSKVKKIATKILLRYFDSMQNSSAMELLEDTDCIIEIIPKKLTVWSY